MSKRTSGHDGLSESERRRLLEIPADPNARVLPLYPPTLKGRFLRAQMLIAILLTFHDPDVNFGDREAAWIVWSLATNIALALSTAIALGAIPGI